MKKLLALFICIGLFTLVLSGCGQQNKTGGKDGGDAESVKTGLAIVSTVDKSVSASDKEGLAQVDSSIVAVLVDKNGKIVKCVIDGAQTKINFNNKGEILTDLKTEFLTKQELGDNYGMRKASSVKKEWNEQASKLAEYVVGKTVTEVKGISVNEKGAPTEAELSSSVTVSIGGYIDAIEKAVANAKDLGAKATDSLGLGTVTTIAKSKSATEEPGLAQAYSNYIAVSFDESGKITSSFIDASQTNVNFTKERKITTDLKAENKTKVELGAAYGMAKASSIGKEWYEQAEAFSKYIKGKTVADVKGISLTEEDVPNDKELSSSVTISVGEFISALEKAFATAK